MFSRTEIIEELLSNSIQHDGTFEVYQLEQKLAKYYDKKYCLLMCNASMVLHTCLQAASIFNEHVIAPAFGWAGSIASALYFKNQISLGFVDDRFCLDHNSLKDLLRANTKAVISIDTGGYAADSKSISEFTKENGLLYISDSAESLGARRDNKAAGAFADVVVVSFTNGKTINTGEMGALVTDEEWIYNEAIRLTQHPHRQKKVFGNLEWYPFTPLNTRVHPLAAIIGNLEFDTLSDKINYRKSKAVEIINYLISQGVINCSGLSEDENAFFEFFTKNFEY